MMGTRGLLVVLVSGGGPVSLTFSLNLAMMMGERVKIIIYEARWFVDERGNVRWLDKQQKKTRRNQVVILQDHVIQQFPENIQKGLFKTIDERVWPTSRNISIREVEDRLFELLEPFTASGQVELICEQLDEQSKHLVEGNFDVLVGADGSNSFVRRYCNIQMISEGIEYACGVGYDVPEDISPSDQTLHQALNCILSASQTRYMVSSSLSCQGYLYIRLGKNEYEALRQCLQKVQNRDEPLDLPNRTKWPQSPILSIIREGLKFFNINEKFISRIAPIEINVRHASVVIRELRSEINLKEPKKVLAFLVGDAAMNVHFWPGRGMNSGMKAAMALARNIQRSYIANILPHRQENHSSLPFLDFLDYESFMARLRAREQQGRSLRILASPIDLTLKGVPINPYPNYSYEEHREQLKKKLIDTREEFQGLPDWPHKTRSVTDTELEDVFNRIDWHTVTKLALANAWPTREMNGVEVLVEDMFPINQRSCLSLPKSAHKKHLTRQPTIASRRRFRILWIDGDTINESTQELIATIRASPEFVDLSSMLAQGSVQSYSSSVNILNKLDVFPTTISALNWIRENRKTIDEPDIRVKVIIRWPLHENKELVDVIRNIRTQVSRVPILVYTNEYEDTQMAFEFPSVIITNTTNDLYEFVGINQETQWDDDCAMSQEEQTPELSSTSPILEKVCPTSFNTVSKQFLLWVDSEENDPTAIENIHRNHPLLEIHFSPTLAEASTFLNTNLHKLKQQEKMLVICRSYYVGEQKNLIDVKNLIDNVFNSTEIPLCVYTRNREKLLQRMSNIPPQVEVTNLRSELLNFIRRHLSN